MTAAERRAAHLAQLKRFAQIASQGWASKTIAAGQRAIEHQVDREVAWDAIASLRSIDLNWWRGQPEVVDAVRAARRAVLAADTIMAHAIRAERAARVEADS
jgi:hypothetical protein